MFLTLVPLAQLGALRFHLLEDHPDIGWLLGSWLNLSILIGSRLNPTLIAFYDQEEPHEEASEVQADKAQVSDGEEEPTEGPTAGELGRMKRNVLILFFGGAVAMLVAAYVLE